MSNFLSNGGGISPIPQKKKPCCVHQKNVKNFKRSIWSYSQGWLKFKVPQGPIKLSPIFLGEDSMVTNVNVLVLWKSFSFICGKMVDQ